MAAASKHPVILVVDDAPGTLEILQRNLAGQGYRVLTAPGAAEAIRIAETTSIDLVITDLKMPRSGRISRTRKSSW
jgi:CheY-like chemotaxis protein